MNGSSSKASASKNTTPKSHVCPPSNATHPCDRWETAFVYAFIVKFTSLRTKTEGFESQSDLEEAILSPTQHPVLVQILTRFVLNLKPGARNLSPDQMVTTLSNVLQEHMKPSERTVFYNEELGVNVDPLQKIEGGIWGADWDVKLRVLRMLVELQLMYNPEIREIIDRAWGVVSSKHRKKDTLPAPLDPSDPHSLENLSTIPLGQDVSRVRYWAFDDSPRLYRSTNPWKTTAEFKTAATTKEEYIKVIEELASKESNPAPKKASRSEISHKQLREKLENRLPTIEQELNRVQKIRKKIEQREILRAQAELRSTRTRRQTRRPDYTYSNQVFDDEDDGDEYKFQDEEDEDEQLYIDDNDSGFDAVGVRRSQRSSVRNAGNKRNIDAFGEWRGERRSARLGTIIDVTDEPSSKRARTEERSVSSGPESLTSPVTSTFGSTKKNGAAAVKDSEIVVEQVAGKKKSKFWYYAVEPVPGSTAPSSAPSNASEGSDIMIQDTNGDSTTPETNGGIPAHENGLSVMHETSMA